MFLVLFFLVVIGFEDTTTKDPDGTVKKGSDAYLAEQSPMFRMALASTVYLVVGKVTWFILKMQIHDFVLFFLYQA